MTRHAQEAVSRKLYIPSFRSRECCAFLLELTLTQLSIARGSSWRVSWKREIKKMAVQIQSSKSQVCKMFWQSADCLRERGALDDSQWILKKPFHYFSEFTPSLNLEEKKFLVTNRFVYNKCATPNSNFHVIPNS